jgi:hypothetical protein
MKCLPLACLLLLSGCATTTSSLQSWKGEVSPVRLALRRLCTETAAPVSVAIYGESASLVSDTESLNQGIDPRYWRHARKTQDQAFIEGLYLDYMSDIKNFHIVDRMTTDKVLQEMKFSLSGALSESVRVKIGDMTGANYLVLFEDTYYPGDQSFNMSIRLVSLQSGEVLASQTSIHG